jgi:UDP-2,4-diacetamido-2,4,6-trideoxy-beta-L-altropyranose hydrolase
MKPLIIRADAGGVLGTGHIMRMIALAQAYIKRGGHVIIASANCPASMIDRVRASGIEYRMLTECELGDVNDVQQTIEIITKSQADWIILDGYHFNEPYQQQLSNYSFKVMIVDDYGHCRNWNCDAILNQNLGAEHWPRGNTINPNTQWLMGSHFALIREEFLQSISQAEEKKHPFRHIVITLGGSDPDNVTLLILKAIENATNHPLEIKVLIGGANHNIKSIQGYAQSSKHTIHILVNVSDMPSIYEWADAVISAGGSTCWEWLAYGLPGAVVTIANNQKKIVDELSQRHIAINLGNSNQFDLDTWQSKLSEWLQEKTAAASYQIKRNIIDSKGTDRILAALTGKLTITIATADKGWLAHSITTLADQFREQGHKVSIVYDADDIKPSDILFLLSFWNMIKPDVLNKNVHNIVVHGSALPKGRGWSPVTWQIIDGEKSIPMTLFEAVDDVDAGNIYLQTNMHFQGHELLDDIQEKQAATQFELCCNFVNKYPGIISSQVSQAGEPSFYRRRSAKDSELDIHKTIVEQFNLLRTVDSQYYPAFIKINGRSFKITIEPMADDTTDQD